MPVPNLIKTVILCALPASGKSEARRYLDSLPEAECRDFFHFGSTVQLDDYPYVHFGRVIDDALKAAGFEYVFYESPEKCFFSPLTWLMLIELLNEDFDDLTRPIPEQPASCADWALDRITAAAARVNLDLSFPEEVRAAIRSEIEAEAVTLFQDKIAVIPETMEGKTVVIEFARGGPIDQEPPYEMGIGYAHTFNQLSDAIVRDAAVLYIWVTPEQSRAKNRARAQPDAQGSILNHGVPEHVMLHDYGTDDIHYCLEISDKPHTVRVRDHYMPLGRFDNREDFTTFLRSPEETWTEKQLSDIRGAMQKAIVEEIWPAYVELHQ